MTKTIFRQLTKAKLISKLKYLLQFSSGNSYDYDRLILDVIDGINLRLEEEHNQLTVDKSVFRTDSDELLAVLSQQYRMINNVKLLAMRSVQLRKTQPLTAMPCTVFTAVSDNLGNKKVGKHAQ